MSGWTAAKTVTFRKKVESARSGASRYDVLERLDAPGRSRRRSRRRCSGGPRGRRWTGSSARPSLATSTAASGLAVLEEELERGLAERLVGRGRQQHLLEGLDDLGAVALRPRTPWRAASRRAGSAGRPSPPPAGWRSLPSTAPCGRARASPGSTGQGRSSAGSRWPSGRPPPPCPASMRGGRCTPWPRRRDLTAGTNWSATASPNCLADCPGAWRTTTTLPASSLTPARRAVTK